MSKNLWQNVNRKLLNGNVKMVSWGDDVVVKSEFSAFFLQKKSLTWGVKHFRFHGFWWFLRVELGQVVSKSENFW